ncbi:MAG: hypothetical protein HC810_06730 [Acaryochloridaceae cyanobacterium RL_2_7]|nr:hypothetical protein [Acaryochloridaceae cyanobacterium RL_2_7]
MREQIELCINRFEKRIRQVHVAIDPMRKTKDFRTIAFIIEGVLHADPAPEPIRYSSHLKTVSKEFTVKDSIE